MPEKEIKLIKDEMSDKIIETAENLVTSTGAHALTVRKILQTMNISNRVFYNRFHNIDEVLEIVYRNTILKIRESMKMNFDPEKDFFEQVSDIVENSLLFSYESKMNFNQYVFENDSIKQSNYEWWTGEIEKLIIFAMEKGYIKEVDPQVLSYAVWCFCRGYNADAVGRGIPKEEAAKNFRYAFSFLIEGLRK